MAIFHCYVSSPEGITLVLSIGCHPEAKKLHIDAAPLSPPSAQTAQPSRLAHGNR